MKLIILVGVFTIIIATYLLFFQEDRGWLLFNGKDAQAYAIQLLKNDVGGQTPDKFIDYTISVTNGYVIFSKHTESEVLYGYFPDKTPMDIGGEILKARWYKLSDKWFVSHYPD